MSEIADNAIYDVKKIFLNLLKDVITYNPKDFHKKEI